jgi:hypothetical protein
MSCGEEVVEDGVEEVRAEGAGLVQLCYYLRHDLLLFRFHFMLRKPAFRARMASSLARFAPCLRTQNCLHRTT